MQSHEDHVSNLRNTRWMLIAGDRFPLLLIRIRLHCSSPIGLQRRFGQRIWDSNWLADSTSHLFLMSPESPASNLDADFARHCDVSTIASQVVFRRDGHEVRIENLGSITG